MQLDNTNTAITGIDTRVGVLGVDLNGIKTNTEGLSADITNMKTSTDGLNTTVSGMQTNVITSYSIHYTKLYEYLLFVFSNLQNIQK